MRTSRISALALLCFVGCSLDTLSSTKAARQTAGSPPEVAASPLAAEVVQPVPLLVAECVNPVNCATSEPSNPVAVMAGAAEDWKPIPHPYPEIECNGVDEDFDGEDRCDDDADHDGFAAGLDCNDSDPAVNPAAIELRCDGVDQNCDGDDACDGDGDGIIDAVDCAPKDPTVTICIDQTAKPPSTL